MYLLHESTQLKYFRNNVVVQVHTQKTLMLLLVTPPQHLQSQRPKIQQNFYQTIIYIYHLVISESKCGFIVRIHKLKTIHIFFFKLGDQCGAIEQNQPLGCM